MKSNRLAPLLLVVAALCAQSNGVPLSQRVRLDEDLLNDARALAADSSADVYERERLLNKLDGRTDNKKYSNYFLDQLEKGLRAENKADSEVVVPKNDENVNATAKTDKKKKKLSFDMGGLAGPSNSLPPGLPVPTVPVGPPNFPMPAGPLGPPNFPVYPVVPPQPCNYPGWPPTPYYPPYPYGGSSTNYDYLKSLLERQHFSNNNYFGSGFQFGGSSTNYDYLKSLVEQMRLSQNNYFGPGYPPGLFPHPYPSPVWPYPSPVLPSPSPLWPSPSPWWPSPCGGSPPWPPTPYYPPYPYGGSSTNYDYLKSLLERQHFSNNNYFGSGYQYGGSSTNYDYLKSLLERMHYSNNNYFGPGYPPGLFPHPYPLAV